MKAAQSTVFYHKGILQGMVLSIALVFSVLVSAEAKPGKIDATGSPHEVVESVTSQLLGYLRASSSRVETDPKGYYAEVRQMLEPVIAFRYIAKNVMGKVYWTHATEEQRDQFVNVFTDSLVETYVKGMATYAEFELETVPPEKGLEVPSRGKVSVMQLVKNNKGGTNVAYTLARKDANSNWQLINVSLGSSNLGESLRSQFAGAVTSYLPKLADGQKYTKDQVNKAIADAIDNWGKA